METQREEAPCPNNVATQQCRQDENSYFFTLASEVFPLSWAFLQGNELHHEGSVQGALDAHILPGILLAVFLVH